MLVCHWFQTKDIQAKKTIDSNCSLIKPQKLLNVYAKLLFLNVFRICLSQPIHQKIICSEHKCQKTQETSDEKGRKIQEK
ncbi:hypothetical protein D1614_07115 [Maribellus luteus]|uniref:Uncharacterized protein n=1 Tax=Maribellus luteus TaxID=2305463 RepID=A0A399T2P8_9BACT|nr:hypothetical protein D1614_07115 [Maribellus luteus]